MSDETEEMIRSGKVVKIEPMRAPVAPLPLPTRDLKSEMTREDRMQIAVRIVELSNQVLSPHESDIHIALRIGSPPNSNVVTVSKRADRVSFYIRSRDLLSKAEEKGFRPERRESGAPKDKDRYRFSGLGLSDIQAHETLFREIVKESVSVIMGRRPKKK
jgi:hypothetical protein